MIVKTNQEMARVYGRLGPGDVVNIGIVSKHLKQAMLIDLLERGVRCYPSAISQVLNGSKTAQGLVLKDWMVPDTQVIQRRTDLMKAVQAYQRRGIGQVVTKADKMHCGYGIRLWQSMEMLYSFIAFAEDEFPFLLQPFLTDIIDVRVIVVGDYIEAYIRENPDNFRKNLSAGGKALPYTLDRQKQEMCRAVMQRARFPFAHIDLQLTPDGVCYLSEIALNGGIQGAAIDRKSLDQKKQAALDALMGRAV